MRSSNAVVLAGCVTMLSGGCDGGSDVQPSPVRQPPSSVPGPVPPAPHPVSGQVVEYLPDGGRAPLGGFTFVVVRMGVAAGTPVEVPVTSDAAGRYEIPPPHEGLMAFVVRAPTRYYAPCPPAFVNHGVYAGDDLNVVSEAVLALGGAPSHLPLTDYVVRGGVTEAGTLGRPVARAVVDLSGDDGVIRSQTVTSANGTFVLCQNPPGTGTDTLGWITVWKDGYRASSREYRPGYDTHFDLQLEHDDGTGLSLYRGAGSQPVRRR